jgi:hypothetical protein
MTLREAILKTLAGGGELDTDTIMRAVTNEYDWPECDPTPRDIVKGLEALHRERWLVSRMIRSVSHWKARSEREYAELVAEQTGEQGKLL